MRMVQNKDTQNGEIYVWKKIKETCVYLIGSVINNKMKRML